MGVWWIAWRVVRASRAAPNVVVDRTEARRFVWSGRRVRRPFACGAHTSLNPRYLCQLPNDGGNRHADDAPEDDTRRGFDEW